MNRISDFLLPFFIGMLVGIESNLVFMLIFDKFILGESHDPFIDKTFAPVFTSAFILIGAIFALGGVLWNIKNQNDLEEMRIERKLIAARASLPVALSELVNICKHHVIQITSQRKYSTREAIIMSEYAQETIKEVIENSDGIIVKKLSNLLACYQIAKSEYDLLVYGHKIPKDKKRPGHIERHGRTERSSQMERPDQKKRSSQMERSSQKEGTDQKNRLDQNEIQLVVLWISLKALTECYFSYGRGAEFKPDDDKALKSFKKDLEANRRVDHKKMFSKYLKKESVKGCGFLDPNYLENKESDT